MEKVTLSEWLTWVFSGGGAGVITFFLFDKIDFLKNMRPDVKRYLSTLLPAVLAVVGWLASVGMGYVAEPVTWRGWIEGIFSVIAVALTVTFTVHGATDLRKRANGG